jgi:hypothetical protein
MDDPPPPPDPSPPAPTRAPLARVALVRKRLELAAPVRVIAVEARVDRRSPPRAATAGGSVWVMRPEHAVEEIPLGD